MKTLKRSDFKRLKVGEVTYLSFKGKKCEICIEPGYGCIDLAVYNLDQEILEPKVTLNISYDFQGIIDFYKKMDEVVNNFYQKWEVGCEKKESL